MNFIRATLTILLLSAGFAFSQPANLPIERRLFNDLTSTLGASEFKCPDDGYSDVIDYCAAYFGEPRAVIAFVNRMAADFKAGKGRFFAVSGWEFMDGGGVYRSFDYTNEYGIDREMDIAYDARGGYFVVMFTNALTGP